MINGKKIARLIDHTLLKPAATTTDIRQLCKEAIDYDFWSVCVNPYYTSLAASILRNTKVKVCSVVGFPFGANTPEVKSFETKKALTDGAQEIDMVINLGALKSGDYELVRRDIRNVVKQGNILQTNPIVKVIIETGLLDDKEKAIACQVVKESGAHFVKTSTGINTRGATVKDIQFIRKLVGSEFGVKASGGIRTYEDAVKLIDAGANRIGTSSGIPIIRSQKLN